MVQSNTTYEYDDYDNITFFINQFANEHIMRRNLKYMYTGIYSVTILLGLPLNTLVIYMISCKMQKTAGVVWFLGLAITDLIVCLFLPFQIISALDDFNWRFGWFLCKFCSYVMFINMYSTALMLTFMRIDCCLSALVARPCCTRFVSKGMVLLSWSAGTILSIPSLLFRSVQNTDNGQSCSDSYKSTAKEEKTLQLVVFTRLFFGLSLPLLVIVISSCLVSMKRKSVQIRTSKPYRIIRVIIIAYFLCWVPYHTLMVMALAAPLPKRLFSVGLPISTALAVLNSCVNPIIYILMGGSFSMLGMQNTFSTNRKMDQAAPEITREEENLTEMKRHHEQKES